MKPNQVEYLKRTALAILAALCALHGGDHSRAQSVPSLINYQGRLTDAAGNPLPNGTYGIAFRIWNKKDATMPGNLLIWGQEYNVAVQNGVFNVVLGAPGGTAITNTAVNDLNFAFTEMNRYFGLTVTRGTNGLSVTNAIEIVPRQQVLTSPFAFSAQHAESARFATNCLTAEVALNVTNAVPSGIITMWSGALNQIPLGWTLCDGTGGTPDLSDKFVLGATSTSKARVGNIGPDGSGGSGLSPTLLGTNGNDLYQCSKSGSGEGAFQPDGTSSDSCPREAHKHRYMPPYYALAFIIKL